VKEQQLAAAAVIESTAAETGARQAFRSVRDKGFRKTGP